MSGYGGYSPIPPPGKEDLESGYPHAPPFPGHPSAPAGYPPQQLPYQPFPQQQPVYQPFPYQQPSYPGQAGGSYAYASGGPGVPSDYPVLGASYAMGPEAFAEATIRQGFIRKVLGIVSLQLIVTTAIGWYICTSQEVRYQIRSNLGLFWLAFGASIAIMLVLMCSEGARRKYPLNMMLLLGFTAAEGLLLGIATAQYDAQLVVLAFALTAGITACLAVFALQTKFDMTSCGGVLFAAGFSLVGVSLIYIFFPYYKPAELAITGFGALLFCGYIVYDIQLLVGGEHSVSVSPEEYIFAAMNIYMDIINLFLYLLRFLQAVQDD